MEKDNEEVIAKLLSKFRFFSRKASNEYDSRYNKRNKMKPKAFQNVIPMAFISDGYALTFKNRDKVEDNFRVEFYFFKPEKPEKPE